MRTLTTVVAVFVAGVLAPAAAAAASGFPRHEVRCTFYDGITDDLLTGGLGKSGLGSPDPARRPAHPPTASELRRSRSTTTTAHWSTSTPGGGYGTLYGPNVDRRGHGHRDEGWSPATSA